MQSSNGHQNGNRPASEVTYAEVRSAARLLGLFTPSLLAEAIHVDVAVGHTYLRALLAHRLCLETGEYITTTDGIDEPVFEMEPLPTTTWPRIRRTPPHVEAAQQFGMILYNLRGLPVRLERKDERRQIGSMPGSRLKQKLRDQRYKEMQNAKFKRAMEQRAKAQREPKWKRRK